ELLNSLTFKHNLKSIAELKVLLDDLSTKLDDIDTLEEQMLKLEKEIAQLKSDLEAKAIHISDKRKGCTNALCDRIHASLAELAMENAELDITVEKLDRFGAYGIEHVEFLCNADKRASFLAIKKVASGGDLSRLMLSSL